jgi:hypothetical protein
LELLGFEIVIVIEVFFVSVFFRESRVEECEFNQESGMDIAILSVMTKKFSLTVTARQLEDALVYFSEADDREVFEGRGKRALMKHYEERLPVDHDRFSRMSVHELLASEEFGIFTNAVLEYEALKYIEYGDPIMLAILSHGTCLTRH